MIAKSKHSSRQVLCEVCGQQRWTQLKSRNICEACYEREPTGLCVYCNRRKHTINEASGLCPACTKSQELLNVSGERGTRRVLTCDVCGRRARGEHKTRDVCRKCYRSENSVSCIRCKRRTHYASPDTGLCPVCTSIVVRPIDICVACANKALIYDLNAHLCQKCHANKLRKERRKATSLNAKCSRCGRVRVSALTTRKLCFACMKEERNGISECAGCKKIKVIHIKKVHLCLLCYQNSIAPKSLRRYVETFSSPYSVNKTLFELLATTIKWESVTERKNEGFRRVGKFLQEHEFTQPPTWEQIEGAMPPLGPTNRNVPKQIRAHLLIIGHLLAAKNQMESREDYVLRRFALQPIRRAPKDIQHVLCSFTTWLLNKRRTRELSVRLYLHSLTHFWSWCSLRNVTSPQEVQPSHIKEFLLMRYWIWECSACEGRLDPVSLHEEATPVCDKCGASQSITKVHRALNETVRKYQSRFKVFFDWAKINKLVLINPVQRTVPYSTITIQHYPVEIIRRFCTYMVDPDADPIEALILYLVIAYGFSSWELRHAQMPELPSVRESTRVPTLAEAYYIVVQKPPASRGRRSPGRPDVLLNLRPKDEPWLRPLLIRFDQQRQSILRNKNNRFLLVTPERSQYDPISRMSLTRILKRASLRVLGATCNVSTLRKTAALIFVDRVGSSILSFMGWSSSAAYSYEWADRKEILPRVIVNAQV